MALTKANAYAGHLAPLPLTAQQVEALLEKAINEHAQRREREICVEVPRHSLALAVKLAQEAEWATEVQASHSPEPDALDRLILRLRLSPEEIGRARAAGYAAPADPPRLEVRDLPPAPTTGSAISQFAGLLLSMFSSDELRRFVRYRLGSGDLASLPGGNASATSLAFAVADLCERRGHARTVPFWEALEQERDRRVADIRRVALLFGVAT